MIKYLQEKYNIKPSDTSRLPEFLTLRKTVEEYRKKYPSGDKKMEVSSSDSDVDEEEQKKIDDGLKSPKNEKRISESV
jgi:hypothetical protein